MNETTMWLLIGIGIGMLIGSLLMFPSVISARKITTSKIRKMLKKDKENKNE